MTTGESKDMSIYECSICGYHYEPELGDAANGVAAGTAFSELPPDWVCPLCGAGKEMFAKLALQTEQQVPPELEAPKEYSNPDIKVFWYPNQCSHAGKCWIGMPGVFDPDKKPWIDISTCSTADLIRTIDQCPSGALKYSLPEGSSVDPLVAKGPGSVDYQMDSSAVVKIRMVKDGPLLVEGPVRLLDGTGGLIKEADRMVLCRCGKTKNPPFCDGSHMAHTQ